MNKMNKKALVLLSGGLDSVVNLFIAKNKGIDVRLIIFFDYGQKAFIKEKESILLIAKDLNLDYRIIDIKEWYGKFDFGLNIDKENIPSYDKNELNNLQYAKNTAKAVWAPNRNGIFINIAAAYAEKNDIDFIITGFNKEEAKTFPDNSLSFIRAINKSLHFSTLNHTKVISFTINDTKNRIIKKALQYKDPLKYIWSCYHNYDKMCGECESCQRLLRALRNNNFIDEFNKINHWGIKLS